MKISVRTIEALVQVISGGPGVGAIAPSIGLYRSGPQLEGFMRQCNVPFSITAGSSRLSALRQALTELHQNGEEDKLRDIIEKSVDPADFMTGSGEWSLTPLSLSEKHGQVLNYLNEVLARDGLELQYIEDSVSGRRVRLTDARTGTQVLSALNKTLQTIDFDTVRRDLERALTAVDSDPESAVTSACAVIESVCRSIIVELDSTQMPQRLNIRDLYQVVSKLLDLTPGRDGLSPEIAVDVRAILNGLTTMIHGIGALRTHGGDAHGRERGFLRIDARIARLATHSAGTAALFLIETWQRKHPNRILHTG